MITAKYIRELQSNISIKKASKEFVEKILNEIEEKVKGGLTEPFYIRAIDSRCFFILEGVHFTEELKKLGFKVEVSEQKISPNRMYAYYELKISW